MNTLEEFINDANKAIIDSQSILQAINEEDLSEGDDEDKARMLHLVLQYRLDTQDALALLWQLDNGILQLLGIGPQNSSKINIERISYSIGNDDLSHILHAVNLLVSSLLRAVYKNRQKSSKLSKQKQKKQFAEPKSCYSKAFVVMEKAIDQQKLLTSSLVIQNNNLQQLNRAEIPKAILNTLSALHLKVQQLLQTISKHFELSYLLYKKINQSMKLDETLTQVLQKAELVLKHMSLAYQPQHFFKPEMEVKTTEKLAKRAEIKRLGHFFW